ncbi:hypothetical protein [Rhizobacter sp. LjRoot28]|uniref:hypothetical protein n=1 Tax=Rhizobacter sp. LjRoot28 TaxID=3342309 RepID=UPI003ECF2F52
MNATREDTLLPRSATCANPDGTESRALAEWRDVEAYVLLAEPGAGKTRAFELEARAPGCVFVKARMFVNRRSAPEWVGKTIFIDALDEMRAISGEQNGAMDLIIQRLYELGCPRFRLSCREADWLASVDQAALTEVAPHQMLHVLHLDPLNDHEIQVLAAQHTNRVGDPLRFIERAKSQNLDGLLRNPLLLGLLVEAVGDEWPDGRMDVYRLACERLVDEHNPTISEARAHKTRPRDEILQEAGLLCAVLLLSGSEAFVVGGAQAQPGEIATVGLRSELGIKRPVETLSTALFTAEGRRRYPRHRTVAEYLAAVALTRLIIERGLPMSRVLALMTGVDGGVVEPLRGLLAWLAAVCVTERPLLIDLDPLACVLYGDVHQFDVDAKTQLLRAFQREASRYVWFRSGQRAPGPFGALGTVDMAPTFIKILANPDSSLEHQALIDCVLDAVRHGDAMPAIKSALERVISDQNLRDDIRVDALEAWSVQFPGGVMRLLQWLDDLEAQRLVDPRRELEGHLLKALFPLHLSPARLLRHFDPAGTPGFIGSYRMFWMSELLTLAPPESYPALLDALVERQLPPQMLNAHHDLPRLIGELIGRGLLAVESAPDLACIRRWLALGLSEFGMSALQGEDAKAIRTWLTRHPDVQTGVVKLVYDEISRSPDDVKSEYWSADQILHMTPRPPRWYGWQLQIAATTPSPALAEHCFKSAACAALDPRAGVELSLGDVEAWVEQHRSTHPEAQGWQTDCWSSSLAGDWRRDNHLREKKQAERRAAKRAARRVRHTDLMANIHAGTAEPRVMEAVALAYNDRLQEVAGDTPALRVEEWLGSTAANAVKAIDGLQKVLTRDDLPSVADIFASALSQQRYYLKAPCLLGAKLAFENDAGCTMLWGDELAAKLAAFLLVDGTDLQAEWYLKLAEERPVLVADVLGTFGEQCITKQAEHSVTGLWPLARQPRLRGVARLVIPRLLRAFPTRARSAQLRCLNTELLPAAYKHLTPEELRPLVREKLSNACLASPHRMAWLIAAMTFQPHRASGELVRLVGGSRARQLRMSSTLTEQAEHATAVEQRLPAMTLGRLIELFAPHARPEYPTGVAWYGERDRLRDYVRLLFSLLGKIASRDASDELRRLRPLPTLAPWRIAIDATLSDQTRLVRSASFNHASPQRVSATLSHRAPANPLDLAALVAEHLLEMHARLVGDDTNSLARFWRDPPKVGPRRPRIENQCRDLLIDKLRDRLERTGVSLGKETAQASERRADLRAEIMAPDARVAVPIEIKKDDHPALWVAWRDQLDRLYSIDPAAGGVGIYLTLWFGWGTTSRPQASTPQTAEELEVQLKAAIPLEDRARLRVVVLDLTLPAG